MHRTKHFFNVNTIITIIHIMKKALAVNIRHNLCKIINVFVLPVPTLLLVPISVQLLITFP